MTQLLDEAGVSRNALYSLARRDSVLPESVLRIAQALDVVPTRFMEDTSQPEREMVRILAKVNRIASRHRGVDPDNVRHTLLLLSEKPVDRLRRALRRGGISHIQRPGSRVS